MPQPDKRIITVQDNGIQTQRASGPDHIEREQEATDKMCSLNTLLLTSVCVHVCSSPAWRNSEASVQMNALKFSIRDLKLSALSAQQPCVCV